MKGLWGSFLMRLAWQSAYNYTACASYIADLFTIESTSSQERGLNIASTEEVRIRR